MLCRVSFDELHLAHFANPKFSGNDNSGIRNLRTVLGATTARVAVGVHVAGAVESNTTSQTSSQYCLRNSTRYVVGGEGVSV